MNKTRKIYLDIIRIIGAFMVLYIHGGHFHAWEHEVMSLTKRIVYMFPAIIVPSAVPLFMMISGSLLLRREDSIKDIWNKRVIKVMLLIIILTILHFIYDVFNGGADFSKFVYKLINLDDRIAVIYWFMYWWLSFSIMLFCYQQIAKALDKEHIIYLMSFCLLLNIIFPLVNLFLDKVEIATLKFSGNLSLPLFVSSGFFYPFLGYYLDNRYKKNKALENSLFLVFIIIICIAITMLMNLHFKVDDANVPARNLLTPIITVCIYQVIKNMFANIDIMPDTKVYKIFTFFGSNTIGVYAFQALYGMTFGKLLFNFFIKVFSIHEVAAILNFFLTFFNLSIITAVLKKIPVFKKALG